MKKQNLSLLSIMLLIVFLFYGTAMGISPQMKAEQVSSVPQYKSRNDIPEQYKWRLEDLYANQEEWKKDLRHVEKLANQLHDRSGQLGDSAENLKEAIELYIELSRVFEKTYAYAKLSFHTDKGNSTNQTLTAQADDLAIKISEKLSFFIPELLNISPDKLQEFVENPEMREYRRWIDVQVRGKDHTLPKEMEQILAKSGVLAEAPGSIFGMLTKDLTYPSVKDESGEEVVLTPANYSTLIKSGDREVRKRAYDAYYKTVQQFQDTFAQVLQSEVKKNIFYSNVRKYPSSREASLEVNQIPISVYDNLVKTVGESLPYMHRYIELKKQTAKLDKMYLYDMYMQFIRQEKEEYISFDTAKERVKQGLSILGKDYQHLMDRAFTERWVDVYYTPGKRTGAYQWGAYDTHPFILLNYLGGVDDIYTLAHEFGHAAHSYFSNQNQPYLSASYPIFTAEVASTTNEALLFKEMYAKAKSKEEKIVILNQRLEDYTGTLFLQTLFAEFEQKVHEQAEKGGVLTASAFKEIYGALLKKYFGPNLEVDDAASLGWARIPHFYRNYYVYQYATGFAAANAFAQQMWEEGDPAVQRYIQQFLSAGDSKDPIEILKEAGVDMNSPDVVRQALKGFKETLDELEKLMKEG